eukprot:2631315-Rhodomonas_salina.1
MLCEASQSEASVLISALWPMTAHASLVAAASRTVSWCSRGTSSRRMSARSWGLYPLSPGCSDQCSQQLKVGHASSGVGPTSRENLPACSSESMVSHAQVQ